MSDSTLIFLCAEGNHLNDDNLNRPICRTCDDDPAVAALYPSDDTASEVSK